MVAEDGGDEGSKPEKSEVGMMNRDSYWLTNFQRDLMAGAMMGGIVHTVVAPIERTKLLLQTQESNIAIVGGKHRRFNGMIDCIVNTVALIGGVMGVVFFVIILLMPSISPSR